MTQRRADSLQRVLRMAQDVIVGQVEHVETVLAEPLVASPITMAPADMTWSIDFHDELRLDTKEIEKKWPLGMLASKLESPRSLPKEHPQGPLCRRARPPKRPGPVCGRTKDLGHTSLSAANGKGCCPLLPSPSGRGLFQP